MADTGPVVTDTLPGVSKWNMYAGGTSAAPDKHSYDIRGDFGLYSISPFTTKYGRHAGYAVTFADEKGRLGGGLWSQLGTVRSPNAGVAAARAHMAKHFTVRPVAQAKPKRSGSGNLGASFGAGLRSDPWHSKDADFNAGVRSAPWQGRRTKL
jgi:hypothetical protein